MATADINDTTIVTLLRKSTGLQVRQLSEALGVTATAVRQRLNRLMDQGMVRRTVIRQGRGRPSHAYELTEEGRRSGGSNFGDLAMALWEEIRSLPDNGIRRGLLKRLSSRLASQYVGEVRGDSATEKMESLAAMLAKRDIPFEVEHRDGQLPVLKALGCPYTELAEKDRSVCSMERMLFAELLGEKVHLTDCRLDGSPCCTFELS